MRKTAVAAGLASAAMFASTGAAFAEGSLVDADVPVSVDAENAAQNVLQKPDIAVGDVVPVDVEAENSGSILPVTVPVIGGLL